MTTGGPSGKSPRPCRTIWTMRADVRSPSGERLGRVEIDPDTRPVRIRPAGADRDLFLEWDGVIDDAGHLRSCLVCGHPRLYRTRSLPRLTPFVVALAFGGATVALLGWATDPVVLVLLAILLAVDIGLLVAARSRLVCYRCGTVYDRMPIARYHRPWEADVAERDREQAPTDGDPPAAGESNETVDTEDTR